MGLLFSRIYLIAKAFAHEPQAACNAAPTMCLLTKKILLYKPLHYNTKPNQAEEPKVHNDAQQDFMLMKCRSLRYKRLRTRCDGYRLKALHKRSLGSRTLTHVTVQRDQCSHRGLRESRCRHCFALRERSLPPRPLVVVVAGGAGPPALVRRPAAAV